MGGVWGGAKWLCGLLESEQTVMVNEGLIALNLLKALKSGEWKR